MTQEEQALQASLRDWAKRTNPIALVRARPGGSGGWIPPGSGGSGGSPPGLAELVFAISSDAAR